MLNGITGAGAVCCQYTPESGGVGYGATGTGKSNGASGRNGFGPRSAGGLLSQIGEALNQAIHGGDSNLPQRLLNSAARTYSGGANVIPFPMVNPFKPLIAAREPITGLTRFPKRFTYEVESTGAEPDDEQSGLSGLGYSWADFGTTLATPLEYASSGPTKLQTVVGAIQATLPATIQALRAQPSNIFPGTSYNPYTTNYPGAAYPGSTPGTGNAAEDVGAGVGRAADTLGGTISRFVTEHPYLVIGGGAALALLFMNPPRRR